jgi:hypothetical protein
MVLVSVVGVIFFTFIMPGTPLQGIVVLWFVTLCPGIALVPLLKLGHFIIEVTLAIALSLSINAIVVGLFLYSGHWSPPAMLWVLIALSLIPLALQLFYLLFSLLLPAPAMRVKEDTRAIPSK